MHGENSKQDEEKLIVEMRPRLAEGRSGNEHLIIVGGELSFKRQRKSLGAISRFIEEIFPDAWPKNGYYELLRAPTDEEVARLANLARQFGAELEGKVRTDADYEKELKKKREGQENIGEQVQKF